MNKKSADEVWRIVSEHAKDFVCQPQVYLYVQSHSDVTRALIGQRCRQGLLRVDPGDRLDQSGL